MDKQERANWKRVKEGLEEAGATANPFYKRAVIICAGGGDPLELPSLEDDPSSPTDPAWLPYTYVLIPYTYTFFISSL